MNIKFTDKSLLRDVKTHKDGYKVIRASVARTGIQDYFASELGADPLMFPDSQQIKDSSGRVVDARVRIYRSPEEVFSDAALNGWAHVPVTLDHPPELVTPDNYAKYSVGEVTSKANINRDTGWFDLELMVKDSQSIKATGTTHTEFSGGYTANMDYTPGVTPDGKVYDGSQVDINPNHMALVPNGRAFSDAAPQHKWGISPVIQDNEVKMDMKPIAIGDAGVVNVLATDAQKIEDAFKSLKQDIVDRDAAIGTHMATIANLEAKQLTDADIEAKAIERATVVDRARKFVADMEVTGKTIDAIKREALASMFDAAKVADFPSVAVGTMFDTLEPKVIDDSARDALKDPKPKLTDGAIDWAAIQKKGA